MKSTFVVLMVLLTSFSVLATENSLLNEQENKVIATFDGITDEGAYKFTNNESEVILFDELGDDVDIDLDDEMYLGKKFSITWEEEEYDILDDDGEATGETEVVKIIIKLSMVQ